MKYLIEAKFGMMSEKGNFVSRTGDYDLHEKLILKTPRGTEIGTYIKKVKEMEQISDGESDGKVIGIASDQEIQRQRKIESINQGDEMKYCNRKIREKNLPMNLKCVEHILGGERIIFYFTAEKRVDFRALVKVLAEKYKTRIEMKQIGARDEASLLAECGICGQTLCCKSILDKIKPVSMKRAKIQTSTLDPAKVSGRCGRLKCCFRYEYETYKELKSALPNVGDIIQTRKFKGEVIELEILTQKVKVVPDDHSDVCFVDLSEIVEVLKR